MNEAILAIVLKLTLALTADAEATLIFAGCHDASGADRCRQNLDGRI